MPIDYKGHGWFTIFQMGGKQVSLPEQLTAKWWSKKKGVVAKMKGGIEGGTGVGDALDKVEDTFKKITWVFLSANPNAMKLDVVAIDKFIKSGERKAFVKALEDVRDLAKTQAAEMKKSKLTKGTGETLDEINEAAGKVADLMEEKSLKESLTVAVNLWKQEIREKFIKFAQPTLDAVALVNKKLNKEIGNIRRNLQGFKQNPDLVFSGQSTRAILGNSIRDLARDMTQPLGNLIKSAKSGVPFTNYNGQAIEQLYKDMSVISNTKTSSEFIDNADNNECDRLVDQIENWSDEFTTYTGHIEIQ